MALRRKNTAMTRTSPSAHNLSPYILAFVAGAVALSAKNEPGDSKRASPDENAKARAEIMDKLIDRLALLYQTPRATRRRLS